MHTAPVQFSIPVVVNLTHNASAHAGTIKAMLSALDNIEKYSVQAQEQHSAFALHDICLIEHRVGCNILKDKPVECAANITVCIIVTDAGGAVGECSHIISPDNLKAQHLPLHAFLQNQQHSKHQYDRS